MFFENFSSESVNLPSPTPSSRSKKTSFSVSSSSSQKANQFKVPRKPVQSDHPQQSLNQSFGSSFSVSPPRNQINSSIHPLPQIPPPPPVPDKGPGPGSGSTGDRRAANKKAGRTNAAATMIEYKTTPPDLKELFPDNDIKGADLSEGLTGLIASQMDDSYKYDGGKRPADGNLQVRKEYNGRDVSSAGSRESQDKDERRISRPRDNRLPTPELSSPPSEPQLGHRWSQRPRSAILVPRKPVGSTATDPSVASMSQQHQRKEEVGQQRRPHSMQLLSSSRPDPASSPTLVVPVPPRQRPVSAYLERARNVSPASDNDEYSDGDNENENEDDDNCLGMVVNNADCWKYHILKYSKDLYMTTTPDNMHISNRVAPSFYIEVLRRPSEQDSSPNSWAASAGEFRLCFKEDGEKVVTLDRIRGLVPTQERFILAIYSKEVLKGSGLKQMIYTMHNCSKYTSNNTMLLEQYSFRDSLGREWIVGNPTRHQQSEFTGAGVQQQQGQHKEKRHSRSKSHHTADDNKVSHNRVVFYNGSSPTQILGQYHRRIPRTTKVLKLGRAGRKDEDDDADPDKMGWMYIYDAAVENQPSWMRYVVLGFTIGLGYSQRLDRKTKKWRKVS